MERGDIELLDEEVNRNTRTSRAPSRDKDDLRVRRRALSLLDPRGELPVLPRRTPYGLARPIPATLRRVTVRRN